MWGMDKYPADIADLTKMFPTEEACLVYLRELRWPEGSRLVEQALNLDPVPAKTLIHKI